MTGRDMYDDAAQAAAAGAEAIRALCHLTLPHSGYGAPSAVDDVLIELTAIAERAAQAVDQAEHWLLVEHQAGRIGHDGMSGPKYRIPGKAVANAVADAVACLRGASVEARTLGEFLRAAQSTTCHLTGVESAQ